MLTTSYAAWLEQEEERTAFPDNRSDIARASEEARMFNPMRNEREAGRELAREGLYVVMASFPYYCRVTSGVLGEEVVIVEKFETRQAALDAYESKINPRDIEDCDPDLSYWLVSPETLAREESDKALRVAELEAQLQWEREHPEDVVPF